MAQDRSCLQTIGSLFFAMLACIPIIHFIRRDPGSVSTWVGLAVGIGLSIPLYVYIGLSINKNKSNKETSQRENTDGSAYRWLIPTVVLGVILSNMIWFYFGEIGREVIFIILSGWMFSTSCFFAFLFWRHSH